MSQNTPWIVAASLPVLLAVISCGGLWRWVPLPFGTLCVMIALVLVVACAVTDSYWRRIPNWATYPAFLWGLAINLFATVVGSYRPTWQHEEAVGVPWPFVGPASLGAPGITQSLLGAAVCFGAMFTVYCITRKSGGDVKLATALAALLGLKGGGLALCFTYILAGSYALALCIWYYGLWQILKVCWLAILHVLAPKATIWPTAREDSFVRKPIPLGLFFALGTVVSLLSIPGITVP